MPFKLRTSFVTYSKHLTENILQNNPVWTQLLGLCPLLAVSNTVANALALALASSFVLISSNTLISTLRSLIPDFMRLPCFVLIISTFTTVTVLVLEAFAFEIYLQVALFIQIIVTNCAILERAESFASKNSIFSSFLDAVGTSIGFAIAIITLGFAREILGNGTLFENLWFLTGSTEDLYTILLFDAAPFPVASLPPGAFLVAGLLLAASKAIYNSKEQPSANE